MAIEAATRTTWEIFVCGMDTYKVVQQIFRAPRVYKSGIEVSGKIWLSPVTIYIIK